MTAVCLRGGRLLNSTDSTGNRENLSGLVDCFCRGARLRIERRFHDLHHNPDPLNYQLAQKLLANKFVELETGIVQAKNMGQTSPVRPDA